MIPVTSRRGQKLMVMGLGRSGMATCRALAAGGAEIVAVDDSTTIVEQARLQGFVAVLSHELQTTHWQGLSAVVLSPGVPRRGERVHPVVETALSSDLSLLCDIDLLRECVPSNRLVGITGTNGKSTTTTLLGHLALVAGAPFVVGGNIGTAVLELPPAKPDTIYILELSSFQLDLVDNLGCHVAIWLNIAPDHLDRHGTMTDYISAKSRIFRGQTAQDHAIIAVDDAYSRALVAEIDVLSPARLTTVSGSDRDDAKIFSRDGCLFRRQNGDETPVLSLRDCDNLPGTHNAQNAAAAYAAGRALGWPEAALCEGLRSYPGLAHRMERLATVDGVQFVNDSKATNVEAARYSLSAYDNVYWLAGGRAKGDDFSLLDLHLGTVRCLYAFGEAETALAEHFAHHIPVMFSGTLTRAFATAFTDAKRAGGGTVLLAPACSSFDQFRNFEERGDAFRALVRALAGAGATAAGTTGEGTR